MITIIRIKTIVYKIAYFIKIVITMYVRAIIEFTFSILAF